MGHEVGTGDAAWGALERVVSAVQATRSEIARLQAEEARLLDEASDVVRAREEERRIAGRRTAHELPLREVSSELGAAMRLSDRTVQARMSAASTLVEAFAKTFCALREGQIDLAHAMAITDSGAAISDQSMRAEYERILLEAAEFETPARLRAIARVVAARIDPEMAAELRRRAAAERRIRLIDLDDGMARLLADLPAVLAHAIFDRLTRMAEEERASGDPADGADRGAAVRDGSGAHSRRPQAAATPGKEPASAAAEPCADADRAATSCTGPTGESRTLDELRADIFADLVLTGAPTAHGDGDALAAIRGHVQITIPVLTAAGQDDEPALLTGYGPIDPSTARELAGGASGWDRVMFHPHTGLPLAVDRYRPSAELRRFLRARDERCRFPGCSRRPTRCDIDHTVDHARGGSTQDANLAHFCRRHHTLKHASPWRVRQLGGGVLEWRSPTGRRHLDKPPPVVRFVPSSVFAEMLVRGSRDAPF